LLLYNVKYKTPLETSITAGLRGCTWGKHTLFAYTFLGSLGCSIKNVYTWP